MDRRSFLATLVSGIALAAVGGGAGYALARNGVDPLALLPHPDGTTATPTPTSTLVYPDGRPVPTLIPQAQEVYGQFAVPRLARVRVPSGEISSLPGQGNLVALTVDDGASSETIKGYCDFVERTNFRMTFFITSQYDGWDANIKQLRRLVDRGNIQIANHTTTHKDLTRVSDSTVAQQLSGCERYIKNNFGITGHPYFRPPFGFINDNVARIAANEGYSTPVLWYGSFGDAGRVSYASIRSLAKRWLQAQHIVIGHANFPVVTHCFDTIESILHERKLQPVTLDDVYKRNI